jgi:uncharacterized protein (UPF0276 family)
MHSSRPAAIGIAFKPVYFDALLADIDEVDFIEVHAENYLGAGGPPHRQLAALRERWPLSIHGVGLSLGGPGRSDAGHLLRLRGLLQRHPPQLFSEHLAWCHDAGTWLPDLFPLVYDEAALERVASNIAEAQDALGRRLLIENPATYLPLNDLGAELQFLDELNSRTGCGLLLDINNAVVTCRNRGVSPRLYLQCFPLRAVAQFHLAGHRERPLSDGSMLAIDDHGSAPSDELLALYAQMLRRTGPLPTLIEWDNGLPGWPQLLDEVRRVRAVAAGAIDLDAAA